MFRLRSLWLAIGLFVAYTTFATCAGVLLFAVGDVGTEANSVIEEDGAGNVTKKTVETTQSESVMVVFTALATGGWLLIPLKFAWDQLTRESEASRQLLAEQEEDRRETATKMREIIFPAVTAHFGPLMYCFTGVIRWGKRHLERGQEDSDQRSAMLFYAVAALLERYDRLATEGMPIILRTSKDEDEAVAGNMALQDCLFGMFGCACDADGELVRATRIRTDGKDVVVSFSEFCERLERGDDWSRLRELFDRFCESCSDENNVRHLIECSEHANSALVAGLNRVFEEWYKDDRANQQRNLTGV